jgi:Na+/glutamate symporter
MIDVCDPDHIKLAIIAAATLGCMFGCLVTQYICNRDWSRYRLLVQQQLAQQQFLDQQLVHHPLREMVDKDCRAGQVIELLAEPTSVTNKLSISLETIE